jgi:hypothetical protein
MFEFFRLWLIVASVALVLFGSSLALLAGSRVFTLLDRLIDPVFWKAGPDTSTRRFRAWAYSVTGAVIAGWGLTVAVLTANAYSTRQAWVWWSIALSVGLWYVLDTGQSLRHHVFANVLINTFLLLALAVPLAFTFAEFR